MKIRSYITVVILLYLFTSTLGQQWKLRRYEAMVGIGTANCFGEIGGGNQEKMFLGINDIDILSTRPSIYIGARFKIRQDISIKGHVNSGWFSGSDEVSRNEGRGFSFTTSFQEFAIMGEYNFIKEESKYKSSASFNRRGMINNYSKLSAYVTTGIGGLHFKPKLTGDFTNRTDYPGEYSNFTLVIPIGVGVKRIIHSNLSVGFELGGRFTATDYLDGFKSVNSKAPSDVYYSSSFTLIYRIKTDREGRPILFK